MGGVQYMHIGQPNTRPARRQVRIGFELHPHRFFDVGRGGEATDRRRGILTDGADKRVAFGIGHLGAGRQELLVSAAPGVVPLQLGRKEGTVRVSPPQ